MEGDYKHNIIKKFCLKLTQPFKFNNELTNDPGSQIKLTYTDYRQGDNLNSFFITPTDSEEVIPIISSLSDNKSSGPNSVPTRILKLLKKDISTHLGDIFNLSFSS